MKSKYLPIFFSLLAIDAFGASALKDDAVHVSHGTAAAGAGAGEASAARGAGGASSEEVFSFDGINFRQTPLSETREESLRDVTTFIARDVNLRHKPDLLRLIVTAPLNKIRLASCKITDADLVAIATRFPELRELALHDNSLTDESVPILMDLKKLEVLDLSNNNFGRAVEIFRTHPTLKALNVSYNPGVRDVVAAFLVPECTIESLQLMSCGITDVSLKTRLQGKFKDCIFTDRTEVEPKARAVEDTIFRGAGRGKARVAPVAKPKTRYSDFGDHSGSDDAYGGSRDLTDAEATSRFGAGYYGYGDMSESHLYEMNKTWNS